MHDVGSKMYYGIHVVYKDDIYDGMADFLHTMRNDERFNWMNYPFGVEILCDRDSTWINSKFWKEKVEKPFHVRLRASDPGDKNSNAKPELVNKEMERRVKSLLYSRNLPPYEWQDCYNQGAWLKNRMPFGGGSLDGDNPRPLEIATNFRYSRKQITKELSSFIAIGTPALTWNAEVNKHAAKGSDVHSRARWGVARSMDRHIPQWFCPFTKSPFTTGSYIALELASGINYAQFLGLDAPTPPRTVFIPMQPDYTTVVTLPELAEREHVSLPAVTKVQTGDMPTQSFVQIIDPGGRVFDTNSAGDFVDTGRNLYDPQNKSETSGVLGLLTTPNILKNGWNNYHEHAQDENYQKMLLVNRPRDFVSRTFTKVFNDGNEYHGQIKSHNKSTGFWRAQYHDGEKEELGMLDMVHYVVQGKKDPILPTPPLTRGHEVVGAGPATPANENTDDHVDLTVGAMEDSKPSPFPTPQNDTGIVQDGVSVDTTGGAVG
jgi:hypothetical protein